MPRSLGSDSGVKSLGNAYQDNLDKPINSSSSNSKSQSIISTSISNHTEQNLLQMQLNDNANQGECQSRRRTVQKANNNLNETLDGERSLPLDGNTLNNKKRVRIGQNALGDTLKETIRTRELNTTASPVSSNKNPVRKNGVHTRQHRAINRGTHTITSADYGASVATEKPQKIHVRRNINTTQSRSFPPPKPSVQSKVDCHRPPTRASQITRLPTGRFPSTTQSRSFPPPKPSVQSKVDCGQRRRVRATTQSASRG